MTNFNLIDFSKLDCTLETFGKNLILRMSVKPENPVSKEYLSRAVCTLLNFGAIDFIPENGGREYENLRPYDAKRDDVVYLQTNKTRLRRALDTMGFVNLAWATDILCAKRDKSKKKARRQLTPFWKEVKSGGLDKQRLAFETVPGEDYKPSPAETSYGLGKIDFRGFQE